MKDIFSADASFNKAMYDRCNLKKRYQESVEPFDLIMQKGIKESDEKCFEKHYPMSLFTSNYIPPECVEIESRLRNQITPMSDCPSHKFRGKNLCKKGTDMLKDGQRCDCKPCLDKLALKPCGFGFGKGIDPEYTKQRRGTNNLSSQENGRFNNAINDNKGRVSSTDLNSIPTYKTVGLNTRLYVQDKFKSRKGPDAGGLPTEMILSEPSDEYAMFYSKNNS